MEIKVKDIVSLAWKMEAEYSYVIGKFNTADGFTIVPDGEGNDDVDFILDEDNYDPCANLFYAYNTPNGVEYITERELLDATVTKMEAMTYAYKSRQDVTVNATFTKADLIGGFSELDRKTGEILVDGLVYGFGNRMDYVVVIGTEHTGPWAGHTFHETVHVAGTKTRKEQLEEAAELCCGTDGDIYCNLF